MNTVNVGRARPEPAAMAGAIIAFVVLFVAAASAYPGGTHFDHGAPGHDFWRNTLCDVARTVALDGRPNDLGCALARAAMITLALGLGVLFSSVPRLFPSLPHLGRRVRLLGTATVPFAIAVVLLPTDRYSQLHGVAIVFAGALGLSATALALWGLFADARAPRMVAMLGALTVIIATADFGLYVRELIGACPAQVAVAVLERLSTILVLAWMASVAHALKNQAPYVQRARRWP